MTNNVNATSPLRLALLISILLSWGSAIAQPAYDICAHARPIEPGTRLFNEDNRLASIEETVLPDVQPSTCIKTYENDLWYTFTTSAAYRYYALKVDPLSCETPAGLQVLLIKTDTCDPATFSYTACLNPYAEEPLEVFWENPVPGETYLVQVDGYDGNVCAFSLQLDGFSDDPRSEQEIRRMRYDPQHPAPAFLDANLQSNFENNAVTLRWEADTREGVKFFLIEEVYENPVTGSVSGTVVGLVDALNMVGSEETISYQYTVDKPFRDEAKYCYQVVKVAPDLSFSYSPISCLMTALIEDFFISEVFDYEEDEPGVYAIKFVNRKRQDLVFSVFTADGTYIKGYTRKREPLQDGVITIDMREYPGGEYLLQVEGKRGSYRRTFVVK